MSIENEELYIEAAYLMQEAYSKEKATAHSAVNEVNEKLYDKGGFSDFRPMLYSMWFAIDAYCDMN